MLQTEYINNLHSNYERILLENKPEEQRYQYCMLSRGGIRGLLPCSLRLLNGQAYLYYDITSKQNFHQMYRDKKITREQIGDFIWNLKQLQLELDRFLLQRGNVLWNPTQIFQDLDSNVFSFIYIPYYEEENTFPQLLDFFVEHIDYEDEDLVECIYKVYEQYGRFGEDYLQEKIFEDTKRLIEYKKRPTEKKEVLAEEEEKNQERKEKEGEEDTLVDLKEAVEPQLRKKGFFSLFENRSRRGRTGEEEREDVWEHQMSHDLSEEREKDEQEYGKTIYIEETEDEREKVRGLYTVEDKLLSYVEKKGLAIGKKKGEVQVALDDPSVSRIHARIIWENDGIYLEDLNSTNGTFKNGLRLRPYEKKKLNEGDEIKCGKVILFFR